MMTWAEFPKTGFRLLSGKPRSFESRPGVSRSFCPDCGTQLFFENASMDTIDVTVTCCDESESLPPVDHVFCRSKLSWMVIADGLPQYSIKRE